MKERAQWLNPRPHSSPLLPHPAVSPTAWTSVWSQSASEHDWFSKERSASWSLEGKAHWSPGRSHGFWLPSGQCFWHLLKELWRRERCINFETKCVTLKGVPFGKKCLFLPIPCRVFIIVSWLYLILTYVNMWFWSYINKKKKAIILYHLEYCV